MQDTTLRQLREATYVRERAAWFGFVDGIGSGRQGRLVELHGSGELALCCRTDARNQLAWTARGRRLKATDDSECEDTPMEPEELSSLYARGTPFSFQVGTLEARREILRLQVRRLSLETGTLCRMKHFS